MSVSLPCQKQGCTNRTSAETGKIISVKIAGNSCEQPDSEYCFCSTACAVEFLLQYAKENLGK